MVDGVSFTDAALERKLAGAVRRNAAFKVKLSYVERSRPRAQAIEALARRAGVATVELAAH